MHEVFEGAPCRSYPTDLFFSDLDSDKGIAKEICSRCPAHTKQACLEMAVLTGTFEGVFGGLTGRQRARQSGQIRKNLRVRCDNCSGWFTPKLMTNRFCSDKCQIAVQSRKRMERRQRASA